MPRLYPSSALRLKRYKVGATLTTMSRSIGVSIYQLSMVERGLLVRPQLKAAMERFLAGQKSA